MGAAVLTSLQNPKVKLARNLMKRRAREKEQLFLIEGFRELSRAHSKSFPIQTLFFCKELFLGESELVLIESIKAAGAHVLEVSEKVFTALSYRDRPDGLLAIAPQRHLTLDDLPQKDKALYVLAEAIEKPGNLGTILRTADGCGADGVIVCDRCTDVFNPNVVRSSVGTLFTQPVVETSSEKAYVWLKKQHVHVVAATPHAKELYTHALYNQSVAIAVGTEQYGLSDFWMEKADIQVKIPMLGVADSLNVSIATSLILYEVVRQRLD
jgi:RNA methyltransferase, TrmH family